MWEDRRWTVRESHTIYETRWLRLREDWCTLPDGTELSAPWYVLEKDDYALIVAVTAAREAVLVRLYKHGAGTVVTEFPAGFIDPGEDPVHAVRRELREETGFLADQVIPIGTLYASPSVLTNRCHIYWCPDLVDRVPPSPEPSERIEVLLRPWDELLHEVLQGRGFSDVSSTAAFLLVHQLMQGSGRDHSQVVGPGGDWKELPTRGAHPVARKYAGVLARGLRPRAGGGWHTRRERDLFSEE